MKMFKMTTGGGQALLRNKQGAVKRALLYILTPIFCVASVCGTVFSFLKFDNKVTANAAEIDVSKDFQFVVDDTSYFYVAYSNATSTNYSMYNTPGFTGDKPTQVDSFAVTPGYGETSFYLKATTVVDNKKAGAVALVHAEITVPAGATIKAKYDWSSELSNCTTTRTSSGAGWCAGASNLGEHDDKAFFADCKLGGWQEPVDYGYSYLKSNKPNDNINDSYEINYTNDETEQKTYRTYFYIYCQALQKTSTFDGTVTLKVTAKEERVTVPKATISLPYTGNSLWNSVLAGSNMETAHITANDVSVSGIIYDDKKGGAPQDLGTDTSKIKNVGEYTIKFKTANGYRWTDESACGSEKTITLTVGKAQPTVTAELATSGNIYITQGLPVNDDGTAKVSNTAAGGTPGKFTWGTGQTLKVGTFNYNCLFTPDDTDNYETKECSVSVKFVADEVTGVEATIEENGSGEDKLYTSYSLATLGDDPWNLSVKLVYKSGQKVETSDYTVKVLKDGSLQDNFHAGTNTVKVESNEYDLEDEFTVEVIQAEIDTIKSVDFSQGTNKIYPNTPLDDIEIYFTIKAGWNYNTGATIKLTPNDFKLVGTLVPGTGTSSLSIVYTKGGAEQTYSVPKGALDKITVDYLTYDVSGITFTGGSPITYNGQPHSIEYSGTLPEGVGVQYTYDGTTQSTPFSFTGAGDYEITLSFTQDDTDNYEVITKTITATLKIIDAVMTDITVDFEQGDTVVYPSTDLDTLKDLITVTAAYNNGTSEEITDYDLSGMLTEGASTITVTYGGFTKTITVTVTAIELDRIEAAFTQDGAVYPTSALSVIKPWLTVTAYYNDESEEVVSTYELSGEFTVGESEITVTYGGKDYVITVDVTAIELVRIEVEFTQDGEVYPTSALSVLKPWLTVTAYYNDESDEVVSDYELTGAFTAGASEITVAYGGLEKKISVEVTDVAIVSVDFSFTQDGVVYPSSELEVLRQWLTVTATLNNGATDEIENYELTGEFIVGESEITVAYGEYSQTITVEVSAIAVDYIEAQFTQGGVVYHTTELGVLKDWLTVTAYYTDGTSQEITDYELSGAFTVGASEITVTYGAEHTDTVTVTVDKVKVTLPTFKGGLNYTGVTVKPTVDNFNGYDSALMTFVTDKLQSGLTVGSYKAVFALNDPENYEWATATTYKKSVFAAVVFDNETEVILNANEAAVDWNIARAVLTATKSDGALPVFASESFIGALSDVVAIKYFKDEACTEEVAAADLAYETQYFVKAELLDTDNFELDTSAAQYTVKSFTYTTPAKELTLWDKIVKFVVTNWLWLVIAVVALILFITIIALIARAAKKKREREEQRRLEEKEEKKREQEERKLEREERMARLSQQQAAMPQMMMPQMMGGQMPMQQSMPQAAQPMAAGGASSSEIAELKAELKAEFLAIKVDQNSKDIAANEIAQLRSEVSAMRNEMTFAKRTDQISGMPVDVLTEALTVALKNVLGGQALEAPKAEQAKKEEVVPVAAQVPPDAIMTTVTTTKIDTTKKPAQSAPNAERAAAPVRTVVRNLVAPMPVDDGRVFDVGGFYKPADPMTDMEPVDDEKGE